MNDFYQGAFAILKYHGFTPGFTINTVNWFLSGSQEIRINDSGFCHIATRGSVFIQTHYKKDLQLLENVIFAFGLNKEFSGRIYPKYADIKIHKMKIQQDFAKKK